ncbi:MAG: phosphatase PAP2 family protein [Massilia sp.]
MMSKLPLSAWAWLPPLVAATLFALIALSGANHNLFLLLNHEGGPLGENFWVNLTLLGDGAVALALVLPCIKRSPQCLWSALIAAVVAALLVQGLKQVVNVPRPLGVFRPGDFYHWGPAYRAVSFPSGHAAAIFAITGIWIMGLSRHYLLRAALLAVALLVSLSRVMVGVHWPLDLLGGMLAGWAAAWTGLALYARWGWKTSGIGGFAAGVVLLVIAGALLVSRHIGIPAVLPLQRTLGAVCLVWGAWEMVRMLPRAQLRRQPKGE